MSRGWSGGYRKHKVVSVMFTIIVYRVGSGKCTFPVNEWTFQVRPNPFSLLPQCTCMFLLFFFFPVRWFGHLCDFDWSEWCLGYGVGCACLPHRVDFVLVGCVCYWCGGDQYGLSAVFFKSLVEKKKKKKKTWACLLFPADAQCRSSSLFYLPCLKCHLLSVWSGCHY